MVEQLTDAEHMESGGVLYVMNARGDIGHIRAGSSEPGRCGRTGPETLRELPEGARECVPCRYLHNQAFFRDLADEQSRVLREALPFQAEREKACHACYVAARHTRDQCANQGAYADWRAFKSLVLGARNRREVREALEALTMV